MDRLDLLLPFYGDSALLRETVESALGQVDPNWRLVVVDDQSPDVSVARWLEDLRDPRIEYHRNEQNLGVNRNFAHTLTLARATHFVMVGSDDVLLPNFVGDVRSLVAGHGSVDVIAVGVEVIDENGVVSLPLVDRVKAWTRPKVDAPTEFEGDRLIASLMTGNWTYWPSLCWRTESVRRYGFRPGLDVLLDLALLVEILGGGGKLVLATTVAFQYRRHSASVSSLATVSGNRFLEERRYFYETAHALKAAGMPRAARAARLHVTSRIHALMQMRAALGVHSWGSIRRLLWHVFA